MRRIVYIISSLLLLLLAMGCSSNEVETAVPTQPAPPPSTAEPTAPVEADTEVQTVADKPQLIEFYAHW